MPDSRKHRSAGPEDRSLFSATAASTLREATAHLSWLLSHGYADRSSIKLVGDRFDLTTRQRLALMRAACSDEERDARAHRCIELERARDARLEIDGYNLLTTVEAALGGGVVILCRDGCLRDMASLHGTWRRVEETVPALEHVGEVLEAHGIAGATWYLDRPVSNSGRLRALVAEVAKRRGWTFDAELVADPDAVLARSEEVVVSADRRVLDGCARWTNLARTVVETRIPDAWLIDLSRQ